MTPSNQGERAALVLQTTPGQNTDYPRALVSAVELLSGLGLTALSFAPQPVQDGAKTVFGAVQAAIQGRFLEETSEAVKLLREKGRMIDIKASDLAQDSITELFDFIANTKVSDAERLNAAKSIFLYGLLSTTNEHDRFLAKEFLQVVKQLNGKEIIILKSCYELSKLYATGMNRYSSDADGWAKTVAEKSGLNITNLVLGCEDNLVSLHLIGKRQHADQSGITYSDKARLSDYGLALCEFLEKADPELKDVSGNKKCVI